MLRYQCRDFLHQHAVWLLINLTSCYEMEAFISLCEHYWLCSSKITMYGISFQTHKKLSNLYSTVKLESWIRLFNNYFNSSAIQQLLRLFNYWILEFSSIRVFHYWIFQFPIIQLFPHLKRRLHPHPDWSPHTFLDRCLHQQPDWSPQRLSGGRLHS